MEIGRLFPSPVYFKRNGMLARRLPFRKPEKKELEFNPVILLCINRIGRSYFSKAKSIQSKFDVDYHNFTLS